MKKIPVQTESAIVIRTDFSNEPAWKKICAAIRKPVHDSKEDVEFLADVEFVDNAEYQGVTKDKLLKLIPKDYYQYQSFILIADSTTISQSDHPLLVVDLQDRPGREFRAIPSAIQAIENNLSIANMDFEDFAESVDDKGIFRGFADM